MYADCSYIRTYSFPFLKPLLCNIACALLAQAPIIMIVYFVITTLGCYIRIFLLTHY